MSKKILVPYFTQSGQLKQILNNFTKPLIEAGHDVEFLRIETLHRFPFPWTVPVFFDTVPESVEGIPTALKPWQTKYNKYDLVILGWQPWNLSPSIPASSLMQDEKFKLLVKNTPVITVSGCRNMWINAQERNKFLLKQAGGQLVGNVALVDRHANHLSYFTIFHWLGTGKKTKKWGIFPLPGVSDDDIQAASKFGETVAKIIHNEDWDTLQPQLIKQGGTPVKYTLMFIERKAGKIFKKWVQIIRKHPQKRSQILVLYKYYLAVALLVASPLILLVDLVFFRPFSQKKNQRMMDYYRGVEWREKV